MNPLVQALLADPVTKTSIRLAMRDHVAKLGPVQKIAWLPIFEWVLKLILALMPLFAALMGSKMRDMRTTNLVDTLDSVAVIPEYHYIAKAAAIVAADGPDAETEEWPG